MMGRDQGDHDGGRSGGDTVGVSSPPPIRRDEEVAAVTGELEPRPTVPFVPEFSRPKQGRSRRGRRGGTDTGPLPVATKATGGTVVTFPPKAAPGWQDAASVGDRPPPDRDVFDQPTVDIDPAVIDAALDDRSDPADSWVPSSEPLTGWFDDIDGDGAGDAGSDIPGDIHGDIHRDTVGEGPQPLLLSRLAGQDPHPPGDPHRNPGDAGGDPDADADAEADLWSQVGVGRPAVGDRSAGAGLPAVGPDRGLRGAGHRRDPDRHPGPLTTGPAIGTPGRRAPSTPGRWGSQR